DFQNVLGTPFSDYIKGGASSNILWGGSGGDDTLVGGTGPATLLAGHGNDSLVAGSGGTTFRFDPALAFDSAVGHANFGSDIIDPPAGNVVNMLDFSAL